MTAATTPTPSPTLGGSDFASVVLAFSCFAMTACEDLPGTKGQQGAVIGGASGAVIGATVSDNALLGGLIGGALGAGGGYLIGANSDKIFGNDEKGAKTATTKAQQRPATAEEALKAATGDVNGDGFVTLDEVIALKAAGFGDDEIIRRLEATGQVFELTPEQETYLTDRKVSRSVVERLRTVNQKAKDAVIEGLPERRDVIGKSKE